MEVKALTNGKKERHTRVTEMDRQTNVDRFTQGCLVSCQHGLSSHTWSGGSLMLGAVLTSLLRAISAFLPACTVCRL